MLFNSLEFIFVFLPVVLIGFFVIGARGRHEMALAWLVAASFVFYGWWDWRLTGLLAGSVAVNYGIGLRLQRHRRYGDLVFGVALNLGLLGVFKYLGFLALSLGAMVGRDIPIGEIVLPLAISFFTFQQIAYLVDVYRGLTREPSFIRYCLFVTFFPQLIAGPIVHHSETLPQFLKDQIYRFSHRDFAIGVLIFLVGLLKKVLIADSIGIHADDVFNASARGTVISLVPAWTGTVAFGLQIYFDFSGYSDMAVGLARMFGIRLPMNFDSPYQATSIIEFWRRWHMTLSRFLRDYLYFPLGGNRQGPTRRHVNLMTVMVLGGLWHGAGWTFVAWGALHGVYLVVNHLWREIVPRPAASGSLRSFAGTVAARMLTLVVVFAAWVFFRAENWSSVEVMMRGLAGLNGLLLPESYGERLDWGRPLFDLMGWRYGAGVDVYVYPTLRQISEIAAAFAIVLFAPNLRNLLAAEAPYLDSGATPAPAGRWRLRLPINAFSGAACACGIVVAGYLILQHENNAFIYFQF